MLDLEISIVRLRSEFLLLHYAINHIDNELIADLSSLTPQSTRILNKFNEIIDEF